MLSRGRRMLRSARQGGEQGSVTVFTAFFAFAVLLLVALLVDGGSALNAKQRAADIAEQAARAAATDLNTAALRSGGTVNIDWTDELGNGGPCAVAQHAVDAYAKDFNSVTSAQIKECGPGPGPRTAIVTVELTTQPLISAPGFTTVTMRATQQATAACGNANQQEAC
jgi:Flp pilus assembly protein TadG